MILYTPEIYRITDSHFIQYPPLTFFRYGPDLKIKFLRRWEITAAFRYGQVTTKGGNYGFLPSPVYRTIKNNIKYYDIYGSAGYFFLDYLSLFVGLRTELCTTLSYYKHADPLNADIYVSRIKEKMLNFTPEIAINVSVPVSEIFTCILVISGTFQSGSEKSEFKNGFSKNGLQSNFAKIPTGRYYALGGTASCSVAVTIPKTTLSLSLGGYYRILGYFQKKSDRGFFALDGSHDHTLGAVCSVAYTFSFGRENKQRVWIPRPNYE